MLKLSLIFLTTLITAFASSAHPGCHHRQETFVPLYKFSSQISDHGRCLVARFQWDHPHIPENVDPEMFHLVQDAQISTPQHTLRFCRDSENYKELTQFLAESQILPSASTPLTAMPYHFRNYLETERVKRNHITYRLTTRYNSCDQRYEEPAQEDFWQANNRLAILYSTLLQGEEQEATPLLPDDSNPNEFEHSSQQ